MRVSTYGATIAALAALVLAGCGGDGDGDGLRTESVPVETGSAKTGGSVQPNRPAQAGRESVTFAKSGLIVSVVAIQQYTPSEFVPIAGIGVKVSVRIINQGKVPYDATLLNVGLRSGVNGETARPVFDAEAGLDRGIEGAVGPGQKATGAYGFDVPASNLERIDIQVSLGVGIGIAQFTGSVK